MKTLMIFILSILISGCNTSANTGVMKQSFDRFISSEFVLKSGEMLKDHGQIYRDIDRIFKRIKYLSPGLNDVKAREYAELFYKYSVEYDLDVNMVLHISYLESRYNERAISRTGDYGLMQINWTAHRRILIQMGIDREGLLDPDTNIAYGCQLLSEYSKNTASLYGIIKQYSPARPAYYTKRLSGLMEEFNG